MSVALTLDHLQKSFVQGSRTVHAVRGLDLQIAAGEFFTFVGASGCGKTTTLRMIAGLEQPTAGRILFGGRDVTGLPTQARGIGMVFQDIALFPYMSVRDNIGYALKVARVAKSEIAHRVEATADLLSITDKLGMMPAQLSGGQQQRVAIGRAIVKEPAVLLLDEPLSALDARLRTEMRTEILRLHRRIAATIIYVTHDQVEALTMSSRLAVMDAGNAVQVDAPRAVFRRPATEAVATFIGTPPMNVWPGRLATESGRRVLEAGGIRLPLAREDAAALEGLAGVRVGIRPQALRLVPEDEAAFTGRILLREPLGLEDECLVEHADLATTSRLVGRVPETLPEGARVGVAFDRADLTLFHPDDGRALRFGLANAD